MRNHGGPVTVPIRLPEIGVAVGAAFRKDWVSVDYHAASVAVWVVVIASGVVVAVAVGAIVLAGVLDRRDQRREAADMQAALAQLAEPHERVH